MDVYKSELGFRKQTAVEKPRPPLAPAEKNNVTNVTSTTTRHRTREVPSRYKSPSQSNRRERCPSPNLARSAPNSSPTAPKRSVSADRRRPSSPLPSTPLQDSAAEQRRMVTARAPESLWPSTMRSLSVSFQSDSISIPVVTKRERPVGTALSERTLRPSSSNVGSPRKPTPERKRSPMKALIDHSENSRPVEGLHARLIDQHRWPSRAPGKVSSLTCSVDLGDNKPARSLAASVSSFRRGSEAKPLQKSSSEVSRLTLSSSSETEDTTDKRFVSAPSLSARSQSLPTSGMPRPASPRGLSPSRARPSTPPATRGLSPSRIRPSTSSGANSQPANPNSVLSFIADFKKSKKGSSLIEDAHQLRLLYNRNLQWRFANARSRRVLYVQKVSAERTLFNVWSATLSLWDSVIRKRINLQQMKLELKLNSVLNDQMDYLDDWALLERDHIASLSGAVEDLEASTLRLPVTGGARADIDSLKVAICSAVDVMQAMAASTCSLLPRAESMNSLVSELAIVAAREKAMLNECEALLSSTEAMQAEEYSLSTHLIQIKEDRGNLSSQFRQQPKHLH